MKRFLFLPIMIIIVTLVFFSYSSLVYGEGEEWGKESIAVGKESPSQSVPV